MTREQIEKAAREYSDVIWNNDRARDISKIAYSVGAQWRINSVWHKIEDEVPQATGEYEDDVYPQIPCLVHGYLATGYGYGVRYWNVTEQVWDEEGGDDYECDKDNIKEWCYLDDLLPEREEKIK